MRSPLILIALSAIAVSACTPGLPEVLSPTVPAGCGDQVYNDPAVKQAIVIANSQSQQVRLPGLAAQKQAEADAVRRCLAGKGLAPPGGVEAVRGS